MDELNRLADDYEWFLQAVALGVIRRKQDAGDREAAFQPRGQYLFEVEQGSGEWLQIGNEYAIRSNGLPPYYREQVIAAVRQRLGAMGPYRLALLAALMRHYQLRVYEPKLEVDETGAQLPSPSLPTITARRLYDQWMRRAASLHPELSPAQIEAALAQLDLWSETVPDSASDAYQWEVERPVDKRVIRPEFLASEARALQALERRSASPVAAEPHPAAAVAPALAAGAAGTSTRYKLFVNGAQHGPYALEEVAQALARGEIDHGTRIWNMQWNPRQDKWKTVGEIPELAAAFDTAIPDPEDGIPDPE
jgi:hypothetical protein